MKKTICYFLSLICLAAFAQTSTQTSYLTIASMKNHMAGITPNSTAIVYGATASNDGDGGLYYFDQAIIGAGNDYDTVRTAYYVSVSAPGAWVKYGSHVRTGSVIMGMWAAAPSGWLILNGGTIGDASSGGTSLAQPYARQLFYYLWNNLANSEASVSTGRGVSALADFNAHKTIVLPDMRGKFPFGLSGSGTGSTLGGNFGIIDHVHSVDPPNTTTTAAPNINNVTLLALGTASQPSHTHDVNILAFNSASANPPALVMNFVIKY
jgi:hypothetical protein